MPKFPPNSISRSFSFCKYFIIIYLTLTFIYLTSFIFYFPNTPPIDAGHLSNDSQSLYRCSTISTLLQMPQIKHHRLITEPPPPQMPQIEHLRSTIEPMPPSINTAKWEPTPTHYKQHVNSSTPPPLILYEYLFK